MKVFIGCEESGAVRDAFLDAGHFAISCDLLPTRSPRGSHDRAGRVTHWQGDVLDIIYNLEDFGLPDFDLGIFHPPCTYLSSSGLHWNKNPASPRFGGRQTEEALVFVQKLFDSPFPKIALENPTGCIGTRIRPADQYIQPYEFGDDASKKTGLWLKNLKPLVSNPLERFPGRWVTHKGKLVERWSNQTDSGQNRLGPSEDRAALRSETYPGIARAFLQWTEI